MALTTKELIDRTMDQYGLRLLAGETEMDHVVTWVHMVEDTSVAEFFWGNELVVTCGYTAHDTPRLLRFLRELRQHRCAGVIINIGKYISEVPQEVIDFCKEEELPLLTMPWEMPMTEFVRDCCSLLQKGRRDDDELAQAVIRIIQSPQESDTEQEMLAEFLDERGGFRMLAVQVISPEEDRQRIAVLDQRAGLRLHSALRPLHLPYLMFRYRRRYIILINTQEERPIEQAARRVQATLQNLFEVPVRVGIGDGVATLAELSDAYHAAVAAQRRAGLQQLDIVRFADMSFYRLFYSVPNDGLLRDYYRETMAPLLEADRRAATPVYAETLFRYLLTGGSLQQVAAAMYTHRNTVNQRMGKIRELLDTPLESQADRTPYLFAYYAGVILKEVPEYEEA